MLRRALNHMTCPAMRYDQFMPFAARLGCMGVQYRNDLGRPLFDGEKLSNVRALSEQTAVRIIGLSQLNRFNDWNTERELEAVELIRVAKEIGAQGIGLIPVNDPSESSSSIGQQALIESLGFLKPLLRSANIKGFIEPLGFESSSLRHKTDAVNAIEAVDGFDHFMLVHDTFHHFLAKGSAANAPLFPELTAIVEVSGVVDSQLSPTQMQDADRVLVDERDQIGNIEQLRALFEGDYKGPVSFEPFSPEVHSLQDPFSKIDQSFRFIAEKLSA